MARKFVTKRLGQSMASGLYEAAYNRGGGGLPASIGRRLTPVVKGILIACVVMYFLQAVFGRYIDDLFALQPGEFHRGYIWQLFTYMFLHGNLIHIFFNMLILVMIGPDTERTMGSRHFAIMYVVSGVLGGLGWVLITQGDTPCIGASGAIFGIIGAFAALHTHDYITVLILFVFPVTMQAWVLAALLGLFELFFVVRNVQGTVAHGVHLAGGIAGCMYALVVFKPQVLQRLFRQLPGSRTRLKVVRPDKPDRISAGEVDKILEKIAREGIGSLSRSEKEKLSRASRERGEGGL